MSPAPRWPVGRKRGFALRIGRENDQAFRTPAFWANLYRRHSRYRQEGQCGPGDRISHVHLMRDG